LYDRRLIRDPQPLARIPADLGRGSRPDVTRGPLGACPLARFLLSPSHPVSPLVPLPTFPLCLLFRAF